MIQKILQLLTLPFDTLASTNLIWMTNNNKKTETKHRCDKRKMMTKDGIW